MADVPNIRQRIVEVARKQFFEHGFSGVTMDEIASLLTMSKKTVYEHFATKDRLLDAVLEHQVTTAMRRYAEIKSSPVEYVDKLYNILCLVGRSYSQMGKRFQDDLRRHRPDLWHYLKDIRRLTVFADFLRFVDEGIARGFVRDDIHRDVALFVYISALQSIMGSELLIREYFSAHDAFRSLLQIVLDGMLTESARRQFRQSDSYHQLTQRLAL